MTPLTCSSAAALGAHASPPTRTDARITADPERLSFMTLSFSLGFHDFLRPVRIYPLLARRAPTAAAGQMTQIRRFRRRVFDRQSARPDSVTTCRYSRQSAETHQEWCDTDRRPLRATYNRAMQHLDRRDFLGALSLAGLTGPIVGASTNPTGTRQDSATDVRRDVTRSIARYAIATRPDELPPAVRQEACRTLLNWVGCAVGGSRHQTLDAAIAALAPFSGPPQASVLGRRERMDILHVALMNGISSHVFDFDDTHLKNVIHPAGPVVSSLLALSELRPLSGKDFLTAMVLGIEIECRIGNAVYPAHYDRGWHITGTAGVFGSAAASGRILGLSEQQMVWALGLAATQPVGLREMFGSMTKAFHPGRAAQNGLTAALLAARNFTSSEAGIEGKSGWANVLSTARNYAEITENHGKSYEILINTYKPFACGVVIHPAIDACIQLRREP